MVTVPAAFTDAPRSATAASWLIADKSGLLSRIPGQVHAENSRFVLLNLNER
ncbi:hypothetical protein D3C83_169020 [compost metagenome]